MGFRVGLQNLQVILSVSTILCTLCLLKKSFLDNNVEKKEIQTKSNFPFVSHIFSPKLNSPIFNKVLFLNKSLK